ncbi:hypothetical protein HG536_0G00930 [Torulaspora globosa]|uniref:Actin-like protein ARP9 n=1 Tax=Torulaspora globosa TaxID=48254 RepID=A0A7G3ZL50_9SACH|nr:uncharacterized protein HG536_0G00930 [Torulaspora globosa]QLL34236.1 hypothetical protein HG536_0G00930 [Torulaspora globosa]
MALFRLDSILIIYPRSGTTLVQFGLQDDVFTLPDLEIPTVVYRSKKSDGTVSYHSQAGESREEVRPIERGSITDLDAFLGFLKLVYVSILHDVSSKKPEAFEGQLSNIPLLLMAHHSWSQCQSETVTQFIFESLQLKNALLLPVSLASSYAMGSLQNCCVIDIGTNHTDVIPIIDYTPLAAFTSSVSCGGQLINDQLNKLLPDLTAEQIEDLKKSPIFEVLTEDAKKLSAFDFQESSETDEGALDVAAIVTSGRDTREILEERERQKNEKNVSNAQLESNTFTDRHGNVITVGKSRFQGCDRLIKMISNRVGKALDQIDDLVKLRGVWENIIVIGGTSAIQGFKEALLAQLIDDFLKVEPEEERQKREKEAMGALSSKRKNKFMGTGFISNVEYVQAPSVIKLAKNPEYFPEWKKNGYSKIAFLGAQIVSKQIFTHSKDTFYMTKDKYDTKGPAALWEVMF